MPKLPDGRYVFDANDPLPPVAVSRASTAWNQTGAWRSREPIFGDARPPCAFACPAGEDIVDQVRLVAAGRLADAGDLILRSNPFPSTTGRVCPHPCTAHCNRKEMDGAVDIPGLERAIGDLLIKRGVEAPAPASGRGKVAVVGAGPAGLTAAYFLALAGVRVTLYDREEHPGGLLRYGIPPYRLPREFLDAEIRRAMVPGIHFVGATALGAQIKILALQKEFDAVLVAVGRHASRPLGIPGDGLSGIVGGVGLLADLHRGRKAPSGQRVVVIGGGNTAFDCARSLYREGRKVTVAYRRDRGAMPAFSDEIDEAIEEGIRIEEWALPLKATEERGTLRGLVFQRARPGDPDSSGRPKPVAIPGSDFTIEADLVVVAAGEELDRSPFEKELLKSGFVSIDGDLRTPFERVFAAGDCVGGGGTVSDAIGNGRRAAYAIAKLVGVRVSGPLDLLKERGASTEVTRSDKIRARYFEPLAPVERGRVAVIDRKATTEVRHGFSQEQACDEAKRCLSCGTCTGCDNCFNFCPDQAIVRAAPGQYGVDVRRCKGCGICVEECPRGSVRLVTLGEPDGG